MDRDAKLLELKKFNTNEYLLYYTILCPLPINYHQIWSNLVSILSILINLLNYSTICSIKIKY